jgi:hypothetical protein
MRNFHPNGFFLRCQRQHMASGTDAAVFHFTPSPVFVGVTLPDQGSSVSLGRSWAQGNLLHRHP